ncbi:DNA polymerase IV [Pseudovibrio exalbescens]|uniref:DNA polymerase IV n=1 Tax=Pseudovibrio exalbescens TaxID=197461 RepID=A0A1U7JDL6_9HYPH|nr:DNA polymerase IV [Pseudovibrio exalbescens]OKL42833.1 DNA polymerase IV [Pseudovibrio exalbescens]
MQHSSATANSRAICRDCSHRFTPNRDRCPKCGSPRLLSHPELDQLSIAHIDCDAFYASIEKRDNPDLVDKPVIVGGGRRGVVATCCYIARMYGVRSAMPMFKALDACPDAVVIRPRMDVYATVGRQIRTEMEHLTPLVEPLSIDEAFLDLSGTEKLHRATPVEQLVRFVRDVEAKVGVTMSVGLAANKFLAKIASDLDKPRGFSVIGAAEAKTFLEDKPTGIIWGVGKVLQKKLAADGITTVGQLQRKDPTDLAKAYGVMGLRLAKLCQGEDERTVSSERETKSISNETTFSIDISDPQELADILWELSEKVSFRAKVAGFAGHTVTLKLKSHDFKSITRSRHLQDPTQLADRIFRTAHTLLQPEADSKRRYRLIGVGIAQLCSPDLADPEDLVDADAGKRAKAEKAMDALRSKFGQKSVALGRGLTQGRTTKP